MAVKYRVQWNPGAIDADTLQRLVGTNCGVDLHGHGEQSWCYVDSAEMVDGDVPVTYLVELIGE